MLSIKYIQENKQKVRDLLEEISMSRFMMNFFHYLKNVENVWSTKVKQNYQNLANNLLNLKMIKIN